MFRCQVMDLIRFIEYLNYEIILLKTINWQWNIQPVVARTHL
jgi:hypothetical protein